VTVAGVAGLLVGLLVALLDGVAVTDALDVAGADVVGLEDDADGLVGVGLETLEVAAPLQPARTRARTAIATLDPPPTVRWVRYPGMSTSPGRSGRGSGGLSSTSPGTSESTPVAPSYHPDVS